MHTIDLFQLRSQFAEHQVLACFNGPFSHGLIEEFGVAVRQHLERQAVQRSAVVDVFAVYVELAQNVKNYVTQKGFIPNQLHQPDQAIIAIFWDGERFALAAGNVVNEADGIALMKRIEELNLLDKEALRKRYKTQLRAPRTATQSSAGLGLLDIARRACAPMIPTRTPMNAPWEFFSLLVQI